MIKPRSKIQLALQGGGAKLSALLAVAEAVQELTEKKIIQLERIAGTSAGAIAGALLAAGVSASRVREELRSGMGAKLIKAFPPLGKGEMGYKVWQGEPFWETLVLEEWLRKLFGDVKHIGDCKHVSQFRVMAANMSTSEMKQYGDEDELVPALMASAGLPICFRTWKTPDKDGHLIIDGGIGENLPIERLSMETNRYGELVAVTFQNTTPAPPDNGVTYALSVLGAAIDVSVRRACSKVPRNRLFIAQTQVETFDFEKAIRIGIEDPEYAGIKDKALSFFSAIPHQPADIDPWEIRDPAMEAIMSDIGRVYEQNFSQTKLQYDEVVMIATARCLLPLDVEKGPEPDEVLSYETFRPLKGKLNCLSVTLAGFADRKYLGRLSPELRDGDGKLIHCIPVPCLPTNRDLGPDQRQLLIFFEEPLSPDAEYHFSVRDVGPRIMWPLRQTGKDALGLLLPLAEGIVKKAIFVLFVPETYQELEITTMPEDTGVALPEKEFVRLKLKPPNGFRAIGWMFENVESHGVIGVNYLDSTKK